MPCFSAASNGALEHEHLVGKLDRVAMAQVDFELRRTLFMDQRVDLETLLLREVIDIVDQFVELVDACDRVALTAENRAAGATFRRMQRIIGVVILGDEIEFDLGRHHRLPAAVAIESQNLLQQVAWRIGNRVSFGIDDIADHLRCRVGFPGDDGKRREIRHQLQVAVARLVAEALGFLRILARNRVAVDRGRQCQRRIGGEFRGRHHLAARHARKVRSDAFDVLDPARPQPLGCFLPVCHAACRSQARRYRRDFRDRHGSFQRGLSRRHKTPYLD